jgi:competence protein ComGC
MKNYLRLLLIISFLLLMLTPHAADKSKESIRAGGCSVVVRKPEVKEDLDLVPQVILF